MSYTPTDDLINLKRERLLDMTDEKIAETYKRLTHAHTGDASLAVADHIAQLERAAHAVISERDLWDEVYGNE